MYSVSRALPYTHKSERKYISTRCKRDKNVPQRYSKENDMDPGDVPACLQEIEEMLIARACPIMCVYGKHTKDMS